jgi:putative addiction module killer protein
MEARERRVKIYYTRDGRVPYLDWFNGLKDRHGKQKIEARIGRIRLGNFGLARSVGEGVFELKIDFGPGYRVYFGQDGAEIVILLSGGDKGTQDADIKKAKRAWADYRKEKDHADG